MRQSFDRVFLALATTVWFSLASAPVCWSSRDRFCAPRSSGLLAMAMRFVFDASDDPLPPAGGGDADGALRAFEEAAAEFRCRVLAFLASDSLIADGDLEIVGALPSRPRWHHSVHQGPDMMFGDFLRAPPGNRTSRNIVVASILVHFVDERLPAVRILFGDPAKYAVGPPARKLARRASPGRRSAFLPDELPLEFRRDGELLFELPGGRRPPGVAELGDAGLVRAFYEGCSLWPDRRLGIRRLFPSFSLAEILAAGPRYAVRVRALSGRLLCQLEFLSFALVGHLLVGIEEAAWFYPEPEHARPLGTWFQIVFPAFAQRDAASLEKIFPERRASLRRSGGLALNLELFQLGVAKCVDSEWLIEVTLLLMSPPRRGEPSTGR
jgi:hypothetical protein